MQAQPLSNYDRDELLSHAVDTGKHLSFSIKSPEGWQLFKSRFVNTACGTACGNIKIEEPTLLYGSNMRCTGPVAVSFRRGHKKMIFQTQIDGNTLAWPDQVVQVQRRMFERQRPPEPITVRFWKANESFDSRQVFYAQLEDISGGGLAASAKNDHEEHHYTCAIQTNPVLVLDAILKHTKPCNERVIISFQFVGVDFDPINQLNRIGTVMRKWNRRKERKPYHRSTGKVAARLPLPWQLA
ncbi:MAG: hypothetical protein ACXAC5_01445 [Promethearchaeota archaeon]|jgi:hypothetical protein